MEAPLFCIRGMDKERDSVVLVYLPGMPAIPVQKADRASMLFDVNSWLSTLETVCSALPGSNVKCWSCLKLRRKRTQEDNKHSVGEH